MFRYYYEVHLKAVIRGLNVVFVLFVYMLKCCLSQYTYYRRHTFKLNVNRKFVGTTSSCVLYLHIYFKL
jgi:hypothetical protein